MKLRLLPLALLLASCTYGSISTGISVPDKGWLFTGSGPYTLKVDAAPGPATIQLVRDLSLMGKADIVFECDVTVPEDSTLNVPLGMLEPGFYEVRLRDSLRWNIGVQPEKVVSEPDAPEDFDEFWNATLAELAAVPIEPTYTLIPSHSNPDCLCYEVRYPSWGGATAGGILSVPTAPGKYPVYVEYMGYGAEPFYYSPASDRIRYLVSVRDQGIFKNGQSRWIDRGLNSKEDFYYRGAFCDVRRALDFVCALEKADTTQVCVMGESQGGAFATVAAALSPVPLKAASLAVPFLGDYRDYARIVWWPVHEVLETLNLEETWYSVEQADEAAKEAGIARADELDALFNMLRYFDVKNFAPKISCPVIMGFGLQDPTCPPHTNFSIYNNLGSSVKQYVCIPTCGHGIWMEEDWPPLRDSFLDNGGAITITIKP